MALEIPAHVRDALERRNFWTFTTLDPDGSPTSTPLWVHTDGRHVLVNTGRGRRKERNVRRDPRVALTMVERDDPYTWIEIRGRVVESIDGPAADESFLALAVKYLGGAEFVTLRDDEPRILLRIEPTEINHRTEPGSRLS
jgi:PPOX class probable F420-dependent enzyme